MRNAKSLRAAIGAGILASLALASGSLPALAEKSDCEPDQMAVLPEEPDLGAVRTALLGLADFKGFSCKPLNSSTGLTCIGKIPGYPRDVVISVPPGYRIKAKPDLVLHFHGHNYTDYGASHLVDHFGVASGIAESGRDAILIAPLSYGNCTDFEQKLVDTSEHFKAFVESVGKLIQESGLASEAEPRSLALTSHSGAYRTVAKVLDSGVYADRINELYMFDSTYDFAPKFAAYAQNPAHRFWAAYRPGGDEGTGSEAIQATLKGTGVPFFTGRMAASVTPAALQGNRVGFVVSGGDHDQTFSKYFRLFLAGPPPGK